MTNPELEAALVQMREMVPRSWFALYQGALQAGFDTQQSFTLLQTWILSQNPNGIHPTNPQGPKSDNPE